MDLIMIAHSWIASRNIILDASKQLIMQCPQAAPLDAFVDGLYVCWCDELRLREPALTAKHLSCILCDVFWWLDTTASNTGNNRTFLAGLVKELLVRYQLFFIGCP